MSTSFGALLKNYKKENELLKNYKICGNMRYCCKILYEYASNSIRSGIVIFL